MKRFISFMLVIAMTLGVLPVGEMLAFADDENIEITKVTVTKTYTGPNELDIIYAEIKGENLDKLGKNPVIVRDQAGKPKALKTIVENDTRLYYEIENPDGIAKLIVHTEDYDISGGDIPRVNGLEPSNGLINSSEKITIKGNDFNEFNGNDNNEINFYDKSGAKDNTSIDIEDEETMKKGFKATTPGGPYRLEFRKTKGKLVIENNYVNLFTVLGSLNISDDITMTPNQGAPGDIVTLEATSLRKELSVFFKKSNDDIYKIENMADFVSYHRGSGNDKDKYIFKVPNLPQGAYEVFITNKINKNGNPREEINSEKTFVDNNFVIISDGNKPSISEILPKKGPATGIDATIRGRFLGSISPNVFSPNDGVEQSIDPSSQVDEDSKVLSNALKISYGDRDGENSIGQYKAIKKGQNNEAVEVTFLERTLTGYIGNPIEFRQGSKLNSQGTDNIEIRVPQVTDEETNPVKDVTLEISTKIKYKYKDKDGNWVKAETTIKEAASKKNGFTFEQLSYQPEISDITPKEIPVEKDGSGRFKTKLEDMRIAIYGKNFSVYRYTEKDENGNEIVKYKYPEVNLGNQIILNKNENPDLDIKVYNKAGELVDGTEGNDLGVKILITIAKDSPSVGIAEGSVGRNLEARVRNPNRNEDLTDMGYTSNEKNIRFVDIEASKTPHITDVSPDTVTTDGHKGVVITGQNFYPGVKVYIDGEEVKGVKRNDTGKSITFDAPKGQEGFKQIIVQNEEGGADTHYPFTYTKTYTDPKITDFNPKKGTATTLVTVTGKSFVLPNPLVESLEGIGINKLMGTRMMLGDKDVNDYHDEGKVLKDYSSDSGPKDKIIYTEDGNLKLSDYYHSVILQDENTKKYYTIYFDTKTGEIKLTDGDKEVYILGKLDGKAITEFTVNTDSIKIDNKTLKFKTVYKTEGKKIVGNKVKVINENELIFEVPSMPREGFYDLKVVNPDTKFDVKKDKQGFYYSFQPEFNPEIKEIEPNKGSIDGGYFIDIDGEGFVDSGGDNKTSVTIGKVKVDPKDITVSPDGNKLTVKVPKYPGNLEAETDMDRKTVAVVVVNPDGGSASKEDGFTYIIPISHPKIDKLILNEGSAAGGESVIIEGSGFRYFEPYKDENENLEWDEGEIFTDINKNNKWDDLRHWRNPETKKSYEELLKKENGYEELVKPILPKVYFGSEEAKIIDFSATMIEVETPKGQNGSVDVYLVNNDSGTSNKLKYNYKASSPNINTIVPNVGRKQGNDKVEILGNSFYNNELLVITGKASTKIESMPLVQFGNMDDKNISNKSVSIDAPKNSGKIRDKKSIVEVGNIKVVYDVSGDKRNLEFTLTEGKVNDKKEYTFTYEDYKDSEIFLPTNLLKDKGENVYGNKDISSEYVRISLEMISGANSTKRLRVDRGFSPQAEILNNGQISLRTPSYYTVGKTKVTVINPDGGKAEGDFEYKNPDSSPEITNILRDTQEGRLEEYTEDGQKKKRKIVRVNISGGNTIDILGTDFRKPVKIKIGDLPEITTGIEYDPSNEAISNKMTFTMPSVDDSYINQIHRVVIENEDGGTAGSDGASPPVYIQFIKGETTGLEISEIVPNAGPTQGGTEVTIKGKDFRKTMEGFEGEELKVYFGKGSEQIRIPNSDIISVSIDKIVLRTPKHKPGTVSIKVENPDGTMADKDNAYTYISNPKIKNIFKVDSDGKKRKAESLYIDGGEDLIIEGSEFMEGARVIFNPVLKIASKNPDLAGERIFIKEKDKFVEYILESGESGTGVEFVNSSTINVTTPPGQLDSGGIIVINPDSVSTEEYIIKYTIQDIDHPKKVRATLIQDEYIRINWDEVTDKATELDGKTVQYEVYAIEGNSRHLIGSTGTTGFVFRDLKPNTTYKFLVRAVGKYGSSKPIKESMSNEVKTGSKSGPKDEDGKPGAQTTVNKSGDTTNVVIGDDAFKNSNEYVIDLTRGALAGSEKAVVRISARVVAKEKTNKIKIVGKDYNLSFVPNVFENSTITTNKDNPNAGVKFEVLPVNANFELNQNQADTILSSKYLLRGRVFVGGSSSEVEVLNGKMNLILDYDENMVRTRRLKNINLVKYDAYDRKFKEVFGNNSSYGTSIGDLDEFGTYMITGSRR